MKWEGDLIRLSASDLMRFMACAHASALDLDYLHGRGPQPAKDSEDAALLQRHGDAGGVDEQVTPILQSDGRSTH
jgi:uncharacterized protein